MRALLLIVRKDLLRWRRSPVMVIVFLLFPVVFALLIGMTFGDRGGERIAPIRVALVDEDRGLVARLVGSSFTQANSPMKFDVTPADMATAIKLVEDDKVSAVLRIPKGFSDSLFAGGQTEIGLIKNPAQSIYPEIVKGFVDVLALAGSSASRILGEPLKEIRDLTRGPEGEAPSDAFISRVSVAVNHRMRGVGRFLLPPAIRLTTAEPIRKEKDAGSSPLAVTLLVLPGMATFALLSLALASMGDLRREETGGTLYRQFCAPTRNATIVLGKAATTLVLSLLYILVLAVVAAIWARAGVSPGGFAALSVAFAICATGFATLMQSLFRSERTGAAVGSIILMVMSMLGGSWIPLDALPVAVRGIAPLTLNYWANEGYRGLLFESAGLVDLGANLAVLLGTGLLFGLAAAALIRRRYLRGAA